MSRIGPGHCIPLSSVFSVLHRNSAKSLSISASRLNECIFPSSICQRWRVPLCERSSPDGRASGQAGRPPDCRTPDLVRMVGRLDLAQSPDGRGVWAGGAAARLPDARFSPDGRTAGFGPDCPVPGVGRRRDGPRRAACRRELGLGVVHWPTRCLILRVLDLGWRLLVDGGVRGPPTSRLADR